LSPAIHTSAVLVAVCVCAAREDAPHALVEAPIPPAGTPDRLRALSGRSPQVAVAASAGFVSRPMPSLVTPRRAA